MRTDRYRLSVWTKEMNKGEVVQIELYDHQTDPEESNNIAEKHPEIVKSLMKNIDRDGTAWNGIYKD